MSSTLRGTRREASDYYVTPIPAIEHFLRAWAIDFGPDGFTGIKDILDPCAGGTNGKVPMSYPEAIANVHALFCSSRSFETVDIRSDSPANIASDYLTIEMPMKYDLIITNPPFSIAVEIIQKAISDCRDGGYVVMLQRLNFLGSVNRLEFWQQNMPERIYVHAQRMGFKRHVTWLPLKERNATDSIEYAHFVWRKAGNTRESLLKVI